MSAYFTALSESSKEELIEECLRQHDRAAELEKLVGDHRRREQFAATAVESKSQDTIDRLRAGYNELGNRYLKAWSTITNLKEEVARLREAVRAQHQLSDIAGAGLMADAVKRAEALEVTLDEKHARLVQTADKLRAAKEEIESLQGWKEAALAEREELDRLRSEIERLREESASLKSLLAQECRESAFDHRIAKTEAKRLLEFVREVARWREKCHEHDADMDHAPRDFCDEEEWEILERNAARLLDAEMNASLPDGPNDPDYPDMMEEGDR